MLSQKCPAQTRKIIRKNRAKNLRRNLTRYNSRVIHDYLNKFATINDIYANDFLLLLRQKEFGRVITVYDNTMRPVSTRYVIINDLLPEKMLIISCCEQKCSMHFNIIKEGEKIIALQYYLGNNKLNFSICNTSLNSIFAKAGYCSDLGEVMDAVHFIMEKDSNSIVSDNLQSEEIVISSKGKIINKFQMKYGARLSPPSVTLNLSHTYSTAYQTIKLAALQFGRDRNDETNKKKLAKLFEQLFKYRIGQRDMFCAMSKFQVDYKHLDHAGIISYIIECINYLVSDERYIEYSLRRMKIRPISELQSVQVGSFISPSPSTSSSTSYV